MKRTVLAAAIAVTALSIPLAQAPAVTVFEGARVIVGDGRTIDNATLVMQGDRLTQVGLGLRGMADPCVHLPPQGQQLAPVGIVTPRASRTDLLGQPA
ncbi:MAG: hypothetical protein Q8N52_01205, partial [Acidobacteriota bacterium]|nr:hypothetical protein [Acidobacteriota bacterium]